MFDRVRIWRDESDFVHYEVSDENGIPFIHSAMSCSDWNALRDSQVVTYPPNISVSVLTDLVAVLSDVVASI